MEDGIHTLSIEGDGANAEACFEFDGE